MGKFIGRFLSEESAFGRAMTRCGIIIGANLMFLVFCFPVITTGPALIALYYVMLKVLRGDRDLNPIKTFWTSFKNNFKQGILIWLGILVLAGILLLDIRFCESQGGVFLYFKYALYAVTAVVAMVAAYVLPVTAAFADTIPGLLRNAVFFIARNPLKMLIVLFLDFFPLLVTYLDEKYRPLYVFLWASCGFGVIAMLVSRILLKDFAKFLPEVDEYGGFIEEDEDP